MFRELRLSLAAITDLSRVDDHDGSHRGALYISGARSLG
jgi:hypothetical protein